MGGTKTPRPWAQAVPVALRRNKVVERKNKKKYFVGMRNLKKEHVVGIIMSCGIVVLGFTLKASPQRVPVPSIATKIFQNGPGGHQH